MPSTYSRRQFLANSAAATLLTQIDPITGAVSVLPAQSNVDKIRVGFIGVGNRGSQLLQGFLAQPDCQVVALCDVYEPYLARDRARVDSRILKSIGEGLVPKMNESLGKDVLRFKDFRQLLERKEIDAVVIATPDHWHALQTVLAFEAGKDVYVEKPLTVVVSEGRKMVNAQKRYNKVAQVGLHRRSSKLYAHLHELIRKEHIGRVAVARAYRVSNMAPDGIGNCEDTTPPEGMDWDSWLGPRVYRPYRYNIAPYKFRWWHEYSSQMGNWGVHYCDAIRWLLDEEAPVAVSAIGGRYTLRDDRTIPDTLQVTFEFASGRILEFAQYEAVDSTPLPAGGEIELCGTTASLYPGSEARGCKIIPAKRGQFQIRGKLGQAEEIAPMDGDLTHQHIRNFLDCVRTRKPCHCDLETGHRSTTFAHLANLALKYRSRLEWNGETERVTNLEQANESLSSTYRDPWKLL